MIVSCKEPCSLGMSLRSEISNYRWVTKLLALFFSWSCSASLARVSQNIFLEKEVIEFCASCNTAGLIIKPARLHSFIAIAVSCLQHYGTIIAYERSLKLCLAKFFVLFAIGFQLGDFEHLKRLFKVSALQFVRDSIFLFKICASLRGLVSTRSDCKHKKLARWPDRW